MRLSAGVLTLVCMLIGCSVNQPMPQATLMGQVEAGMPAMNKSNAIYELPVREGLSYQDVADSLKSLALSMNFVNPANFSITEHIKNRGIDPQGIKEVQSFCNLSLGTEIFLDHPEFLVFAPCRIAIYEKPDANKRMRLFIALARPTYDLSHIKQPSLRAQQAAVALETSLLSLIHKASKGDF
ncbi:MAG: DUF302 domain-containing protein [Methylotenera sp.]|nr:DUF302 domain-containing protein [Methylotenera sp.]